MKYDFKKGSVDYGKSEYVEYVTDSSQVNRAEFSITLQGVYQHFS